MIPKALPRADDGGGGGSYVAPVEAWGGRSENLQNKAKMLFKGFVMLD